MELESEVLNQPSLEALFAGLEQTQAAAVMRDSVWLFPVVELLHILGFVLLAGAAAMFDLRLLGLSRGISVTALAAHLLPWSRTGLLLAAPTGLLMFVSDATMTAANPAFRIKMVLLTAGMLNALVFHALTFRTVETWDQTVTAPIAARFTAIVSLLVWTGVIAAGRFIAYV